MKKNLIGILVLCGLLPACSSLQPSPKLFPAEGGVWEVKEPTEIPFSVGRIPANVKIHFSANGRIRLHSRQQLDILASIEADPGQMIFEIPDDATLVLQSETVSPKWWGAKGDGKTNDTKAFQQASSTLQAQGGGKLLIPEGEYIVGGQLKDPRSSKPFKMLAQDIMHFKNLPRPLVIEGQGRAILRFQPGLKFGSFDPMSGLAFAPRGRFLNHDYANEAGSMIDIWGSADVTIRDLELDGNLEKFQLGGPFGDQGRQLDACGIRIYNTDKVLIQNMNIHDQGLDGILLGFQGLTDKSPKHPQIIENVTSQYNARQGLSVVGSNDLIIRNSKFNHTGRHRFHTSPGAGIDIEAEKSVNRNLLIENVEAIDNTGVGIVADSGDSADITIRRSRIIGTSHYALWLRKPRIRIEDSHITGTSVNFFNKGQDALQATNTTFDDLDAVENGTQYRAFRSSAVIELDHAGGDIIFDQVTVIGSQIRPLWIDGGHLKNSTVILKKSDFKPGEFAVLARETSLENVRFKFEPNAIPAEAPMPPWYIASGSCQNGKVRRKQVSIDSTIGGKTFLNWCSPKGKSGIVFP